MSDIQGIPTTEGNPIEPRTGILDVNDTSEDLAEDLPKKSEKIGKNEEELGKENPVEGASDSEVLEVGQERIQDINGDVENVLNNPQESQNSYLIKQLKEPEAQDPEIGKEQLLKIDEINNQIEKVGNEAKNYITKISGLDKQNYDIENNPSEEKLDKTKGYGEIREKDETIEGKVVDEDGEGEVKEVKGDNNTLEQEENYAEKKDRDEEIIDGEWILVDEGLDPETEEFLSENGEEDLTGELTPEELRLYESFRQLILDRFPPVGSVSSAGTLNNMLDSLPNEEGDTLKQVIKILLRTAVRLGTRVVAFVADEIVKSTDKDDKTTRFIFGSIRDAAKGVESAADTFITGEERTGRLTKTIRDRIFQKKQQS